MRVARLLEAAESLRATVGAPLPSKEHSERQRELVAARIELGDVRFAKAWAEGQAMTMEQAVAYAPEELPSA